MSNDTLRQDDLFGPAGKWPVIAAVCVVLCALGLVGLGVTTGVGTVKADRGSIIESRALEIRDLPDGAIAVIDVDSGNTLQLIPSNGGGFIRGAKRGIDRLREMNGVAPQTPFELNRFANGDLTLTDTGTEEEIALSSFGPQNARQFGALLSAQ